MKPKLPTNAMISVFERSISRLEPNVGGGTDLSPQSQELILLKISEPIICTENTADTTVPINSCVINQAMAVPSRDCKNNELSPSEAGKVMVVLCDIDGFSKGKYGFDSVTQHSPDDSVSDTMDVLENGPLCESLSWDHVPTVEKNDVQFDEPLGNICEKNATKVGQETSLDELGIVSCVLKPIIQSKRNSNHEQLDSATQLSPGKNTGEQTNVFGNDALSCKHLHLGDTHEEKENVVSLEGSQSTTVMNEDIARKDVTETTKNVSNLESNLDDGVISNTENSVGEQHNGNADNKYFMSSERNLVSTTSVI